VKTAIIVGSTGQDGTYLSQLLKKKKYRVVGISSKEVNVNGYTRKKIDIKKEKDVSQIIKRYKPNEVYYLAVVHHSSADKLKKDGDLFKKSLEINTMGLINFLEAIRLYSQKTRIFYAASSHVFGNPLSIPQNENTVMQPNCIYGITKVAGTNACHFYRDEHNIFASVGIFYNHESPVRQSKYVSTKIVETAIAIKRGSKKKLILGSLETKIDWGYAPDYMEAAYRILHHNKADDFIISSGNQHTVREFVEEVFSLLKMDWRKFVEINPSLITKKPKNNLFGNNEKIRSQIGWTPKTDFPSMIKILVREKLKA
jgi:GDPmannose 4,6-dehydratase